MTRTLQDIVAQFDTEREQLARLRVLRESLVYPAPADYGGIDASIEKQALRLAAIAARRYTVEPANVECV